MRRKLNKVHPMLLLTKLKTNILSLSCRLPRYLSKFQLSESIYSDNHIFFIYLLFSTEVTTSSLFRYLKNNNNEIAHLLSPYRKRITKIRFSTGKRSGGGSLDFDDFHDF